MIENYGIINDRAPHLVADLCEIIAYFENREVSRGDVEGFLNEKGGAGLLQDLEVDDASSAEANEKFQALSEEVMRHLAYRQTAFGDWYPFNVEADVLVPVEQVTTRHRCYAALLGFSRLRMFNQARITAFAADFERLCLEAAEAFASGWKVVHFGAGGRDRALFGNKLKDALRGLAATLKEMTVEAHIEELPNQNVGDAGIDIVLYKDWGDNARSTPAFFAQCASQQDAWPAKRFEASALNLTRYFNFFHCPGTILFIPVCYRNVDGSWINSSGHTTLLIDRLRLVQLLDKRIEIDGAQVDEVLTRVPRPFALGCANPALR